MKNYRETEEHRRLTRFAPALKIALVEEDLLTAEEVERKVGNGEEAFATCERLSERYKRSEYPVDFGLAHLAALIGASLLIGLGACRPQFNLSRKVSKTGTILSVYGFWGGWDLYFFAAALGAGKMFPMVRGNTHGNTLVETLISFGVC